MRIVYDLQKHIRGLVEANACIVVARVDHGILRAQPGVQRAESKKIPEVTKYLVEE